MRFKPRHYVLIALLVGVGIWNFRRRHDTLAHTAVPVRLSEGPRGTAPQWTQFDAAAAQRDAADAQFQPTRVALAGALAAVASTANDDLTNLRACQTWLLFYRQEVIHPSTRPGWKVQTQSHTVACAADHRDTSR